MNMPLGNHLGVTFLTNMVNISLFIASTAKLLSTIELNALLIVVVIQLLHQQLVHLHTGKKLTAPTMPAGTVKNHSPICLNIRYTVPPI